MRTCSRKPSDRSSCGQRSVVPIRKAHRAVENVDHFIPRRVFMNAPDGKGNWLAANVDAGWFTFRPAELSGGATF
jgi:hypothetical protein